ncbi:MAG: hypothetical protein GF307_08740 [candidate division Zixibacteria bacterium]|nr:hypothetical protein [candidate division Zixibacteria bacterium]
MNKQIKLIFNTDYRGTQTARQDTTSVFLHWLPFKFSLENGGKSILLDELIDNETREDIDRLALELSRNWYKPENTDFTVYQGISIGELAEYHILLKLYEILKLYYAYRELLQYYSPQSIITDLPEGSLYCNFTKDFFETNNIPVMTIKPSANNPFSMPTAPGSVYNGDSRFNVHKWLRKNYYEMVSRGSGKEKKIAVRTSPVIFSCYRNEFMVLEYLMGIDFMGILPILDMQGALDRDLFSKLMKAGAKTLPDRTTRPGGEQIKLTQDAVKSLTSQSFNTYLRQLVVDGPLRRAVIKLLHNFVFKNYPVMSADIFHYRKLFEQIKPAALVVPNDTIPHQKMLVKIAKHFECKSILIQHGYHANLNDGDKRSSDYVAVWGEKDRERLVAGGRKRESIEVLGNPYHDPLMQESESDQHIRENRILVITHPEDRLSACHEKVTPEKYVEEVVKAMDMVDDSIEWVIKIHPSEFEDYYKNILKLMGREDVEVVKKADLVMMLKTCKCAVLPDSTVYSEAHLCRTPMVCLNITDRAFVSPLDGNSGITVVKNGEQLAEEINRTLANKSLPAVDGYNGHLLIEKNAVRRVAKYILKNVNVDLNDEVRERMPEDTARVAPD